MKPRDIFDIGVVLSTDDQAELVRQLGVLVPVKTQLERRLATLPDAYYQAALAELEIFDAWQPLKAAARPMVTELVRMIP